MGRLVEDLMLQGGVDQSHVRWVPYDGVGRRSATGSTSPSAASASAAPSACSDRGHTARQPAAARASRLGRDLRPATASAGSTAAASSRRSRESTAGRRRGGDGGRPPARHHRLLRPQLPAQSCGRPSAAGTRPRGQPARCPRTSTSCSATRRTSRAALGFAVEGVDEDLSELDAARFDAMIDAGRAARTRTSRSSPRPCGRCAAPPATTGARSAAATGRRTRRRPPRAGDPRPCRRRGLVRLGPDLRAARGLGPQEALEYGAAHGALAMTTPGDTSMATLAEVRKLVAGGGARVSR